MPFSELCPREILKSGRLRLAVLLCTAVTFACDSVPWQSWRLLGQRAPIARNVLLITVDTLRADHVGAYGGPVSTPAMDELASAGALLSQFCTPTPSTGPAHASLMTGLYPWKHGVLANAVPFTDEQPPVLATLAREAGVATAAFVSSYVLHGRWGFSRGFDSYHFDPSQESTWRGQRVGFWERGGKTTDSALRWLGEHRDERFMLWIHYFDPHGPYDPPPGFRRAPDEPVDLTGKSLPEGIRTPRQLAAMIRGYRGEVAYTDSQVGRLLDELRYLELLEETAVILTSDHGEGLGDHGELAHGKNLFDELVRIPLLIRAPGIEGGQRLEGPAQLEDLMPTVLSLLGLPIPEGIDGRDLLPWLSGRTDASPRSAVLGQRAPFRAMPLLFYQRDWPEKWIGELGLGGRAYGLENDPGESTGVPTDRVPPMLRGATDGMPHAKRRPALDEEARRALKALGYLE